LEYKLYLLKIDIERQLRASITLLAIFEIILSLFPLGLMAIPIKMDDMMTKDPNKVLKSLTTTWASSTPCYPTTNIASSSKSPNTNYPRWNQVLVHQSEKDLHPSILDKGDVRRSTNDSMYHC
jgi:hypothetical protein